MSARTRRGRYQSLTVKRKLEIIDLVEKAPPGKKKKDIAAELSLPASTLSTVLKNKASLRASHAFGSSKKKRHRDPSRADVDAALFQWFVAARTQSIPISGEIMKAKAEELALELDPAAPWTCSSGWLSRWKKRHNIKYRSVCGENASVDQSVCDDWKQSTLQAVLQCYNHSDIFNADETGLFWRLLPDKTHAATGETCTGGKKSKERITLLICANMDGTEKRPLLAIGKFKSPRCFRNIQHLPTEYDANKSAWMTSAIFEGWLRKWDNELSWQGRKIALFIDNCTAHPQVQDLQSIELFFLSPNTTSELQPCDQGIINALKAHYRKNMVKQLIQAIDNGSTLAKFKISLLDALRMARAAWDSVTAETVANCFRKGGFSSPSEDTDSLEEDRDLQEQEDEEQVSLDYLNLEDRCSFEEYVNCDSHLLCVPMLTSQDIVSSVAQNPVGEAVDDADDAGDPLPSVSSQQAHSSFLNIKAFLLRTTSSSNAEHAYCLLRDLEVELEKGHFNACTQTTITDFFTSSVLHAGSSASLIADC